MTPPAIRTAPETKDQRLWGRYILDWCWLLIMASFAWRNISKMSNSGFAWRPMLISAAACVALGVFISTVLDGPKHREDVTPPATTP